MDQIKSLVSDIREGYDFRHPASKSILAEFKDEPKKNLEFNSLNCLAKHLKGNRQVIRKYLKVRHQVIIEVSENLFIYFNNGMAG